MRDPILKEFIRVFNNSHVNQSQLARSSGICTSTIRSWRNGKVQSPKVSTMRFALKYLGYEIIVTTNKTS